MSMKSAAAAAAINRLRQLVCCCQTKLVLRQLLRTTSLMSFQEARRDSQDRRIS